MECIFCEGKLKEFFIMEFQYWVVYLNPDQYFLGRVYVVLRRHGPEFTAELTDREWKEFKEVIDKVTKAQKLLYNPDLMNYAILQIKDRNHFHMHLIPRYSGVRIIHGQEFKDDSWGKVPFPSPKKEFEHELLIKIKKDIENNL